MLPCINKRETAAGIEKSIIMQAKKQQTTCVPATPSGLEWYMLIVASQ